MPLAATQPVSAMPQANPTTGRRNPPRPATASERWVRRAQSWEPVAGGRMTGNGMKLGSNSAPRYCKFGTCRYRDRVERRYVLHVGVVRPAAPLRYHPI